MASYIDNFNNSQAPWGKTFQRTSVAPLDRSSMFGSLADATKYAKGDGSDERQLGGTAYIGQVIGVYENDKVTIYKLVPSGGVGKAKLVEIGGSGSGTKAVNTIDLAIADARNIKKEGKDPVGQMYFVKSDRPGHPGEAGTYIVSKSDASLDGNVETAIEQCLTKFGAATSADELASRVQSLEGTVQGHTEVIKNLPDNYGINLSTTTTTQGFLKTYTLTQGSKSFNIDIPKDFLVKSGDVVKGTWDAGRNKFTESPEGADKALKLVINAKEGEGEASNVYIDVQDLGKTLTFENGVKEEGGKVSLVVDTASQRYLAASETGLKLELGTLTTDLFTKDRITGDSNIVVTHDANKNKYSLSLSGVVLDSDYKADQKATSENISDLQKTTKKLHDEVYGTDGSGTAEGLIYDVAGVIDVTNTLDTWVGAQPLGEPEAVQKITLSRRVGTPALDQKDKSLFQHIADINSKLSNANVSIKKQAGSDAEDIYWLVDSNGQKVNGSDEIKIKKDNSLKTAELGHMDDTIDSSTGTINKVGTGSDALILVYRLADGTYSGVKVDLGAFLLENEAGTGIYIDKDHKINIDLGTNVNKYLDFSKADNEGRTALTLKEDVLDTHIKSFLQWQTL